MPSLDRISEEHQALLKDLCVRIEAECSGVVVAVSRDTRDGPDEDIVSIDILNVPSAEYDRTYERVLDWVASLAERTSLPLAFNIWDPEQSTRYFGEALKRLRPSTSSVSSVLATSRASRPSRGSGRNSLLSSRSGSVSSERGWLMSSICATTSPQGNPWSTCPSQSPVSRSCQGDSAFARAA